MNKVIAFIKEYSFLIGCIVIVASFLGAMYGGFAIMNARAAAQHEAEAKLEARYKYTIRHRHAGRISYTSSYYTDAYEIDGQLVKFTDHDGHSMLVSGDVTIVENNNSN